MRVPTGGDPTQPIFYLLAVGSGRVYIGDRVGSTRLYRYQHVGIWVWVTQSHCIRGLNQCEAPR